MRKLILILFFSLITVNSYAALFGIAGKTELNAVKNVVKNSHNELSAIKKLCLSIKSDIKVNNQINAKAFAGLDISKTNTAGRDVNTNNDSDMIVKIYQCIVGSLTGIILFLLMSNRLERNRTSKERLKNLKYTNDTLKENEKQIRSLTYAIIKNKNKDKKEGTDV